MRPETHAVSHDRDTETLNWDQDETQ